MPGPLGLKSRVAFGEGEVNFDSVQRQQHSDGAVKGAFGASALIGMEIATYKAQGRWPANVIHDGLEEEWSRFFYCAKASKSERNAGLERLPERRESDRVKDDGAGGDNPRNRSNEARQNFHPTVKPLALMRYLIKLVTPPGGIVLDPFLGSGTTAVAATLEGFDWVGCEMTEDYWPIIEARVEWAKTERTTTLF
jgi:site-specific DNA-methyltransferase (adenine-specific)